MSNTPDDHVSYTIASEIDKLKPIRDRIQTYVEKRNQDGAQQAWVDTLNKIIDASTSSTPPPIPDPNTTKDVAQELVDLKTHTDAAKQHIKTLINAYKQPPDQLQANERQVRKLISELDKTQNKIVETCEKIQNATDSFSKITEEQHTEMQNLLNQFLEQRFEYQKQVAALGGQSS